MTFWKRQSNGDRKRSVVVRGGDGIGWGGDRNRWNRGFQSKNILSVIL